MSGWWSLGGYVTEGCIDQHLAAVMDEDEDVCLAGGALEDTLPKDALISI